MIILAAIFVFSFMAIKNKNPLCHGADSDSAPSNYVESTP